MDVNLRVKDTNANRGAFKIWGGFEGKPQCMVKNRVTNRVILQNRNFSEGSYIHKNNTN